MISNGLELTDKLLAKLVELEGNIPCSCSKQAYQNYQVYPLQLAAIHNNERVVDEILAQYPLERLKSQCPLHALARFDVCWQYDKFKDFLGAYDLDSGYTAMMVCCINNSANVFKKLCHN